MTSNTSLQLPERIIVEAHEWRAEMDEDAVELETIEAFSKWLDKDDRHKQAYENAEKIWEGVATIHIDDLPKSSPQKPITRNWVWAGSIAVAASLLLMFNSLTIERLLLQAKGFDTVKASTASNQLPDGSRVYLDAETKISVLPIKQTRTNILHEGTAFFDVVSNKEVPFIIEAGLTSVQVTGTSFEVKHLPNGTMVTVASGAVKVSNLKNTGKTLSLQAGQQVAFYDDGVIGKVKSVKPSDIAAWRKGKLNYFKTPLVQVLEDAKRHFDGQLYTIGDVPDDMRVTGVFDIKNPNDLLATLKEIFPMKMWQVTDDVILITLSS